MQKKVIAPETPCQGLPPLTRQAALQKGIKPEPNLLKRKREPEVVKSDVEEPKQKKALTAIITLAERKVLFVKYLRTILPTDKQQWAEELEKTSTEAFITLFKTRIIPVQALGALGKFISIIMYKHGVTYKDLGATPEDQKRTMQYLVTFISLFGKIIKDNGL